MSELWDAPNQQVVRPDNSAPWEEGTGGDAEGLPEVEGEPSALDAMTKDDLMAYAAANGIEVSAAWTKAEIKAAIEEAGG